MEIRKAAVIGSGTMGSGIAAHLANANIPVILLDIVPKGATNRSILAEEAVQRMKQQKDNPPFSIPEKADFITCGNLEDDLEQLRSADWIIEAVVEKLAIKQELYRKINPYRSEQAILSSNTSTIPLAELAKGLPEDATRNLGITHFYNPPRYTGLMEIIAGNTLDENAVTTLVDFCDIHLGKKVVIANDTPGFIGNRIGIYWMLVGLHEAIAQGITIEQADSLLSKPLGIPKTGIFGLFDLIGLDVMMDIINSLEKNLPKTDPFFEVHDSKALLAHMIDEGLTGRKAKGGFYRMVTENGTRRKETIDLKTGSYRAYIEPSIYVPPEGLRIFYSYCSYKKPRVLEPALEGGFHESADIDLGEDPTHPLFIKKEAMYVWAVMSRTMAYAASLIPEIADDIVAIDTVMHTGFNWKYGPFEMIDQLGNAWFTSQLLSERRNVPPLLRIADNMNFYKTENNIPHFLTKEGTYSPIPKRPGAWTLKDNIRGQTPVLETPSARLWDIGDGIACLEFTTKMNTIDHGTFDCIAESLERVKEQFSGMIIGNDSANFSAGLNLHIVLDAARQENWEEISRILRRGQDSVMQIKYAPFPVIAAVSGLALGGGCEMLLHCDAVQSHLETKAGLVEVNIGVVPSWGGCTEMLYHHIHQNDGSEDILATVSNIFDIIGSGTPSTSGDEARKMGYLREKNHISMNRERLLPDAKALCLSLTENYQPPQPYTITLPFVALKEALSSRINAQMDEGTLTAHDVRVRHYLATVLSGGHGESDQPVSEQNLLDLEHDAFMELVKTKETQARIEYTLKTGKPLKN